MSIIEQAKTELALANFGEDDSGGAVSVAAPVLQRLIAGKPTPFSEVKAGDMIMANGVHKCLRPGQVCKVYADDGKRSGLHVVCDWAPEKHFLIADTDGNLSGFQKMRQQVENA